MREAKPKPKSRSFPSDPNKWDINTRLVRGKNYDPSNLYGPWGVGRRGDRDV